MRAPIIACCLLGLASLATPSAALAQAAAKKSTAPLAVEEPRDVVAKIYEKARAGLRKKNPESPFFSRSIRETFFSKGFDLLITTAETKAAHAGEAALDFDPVSASQDAEIQKVTLKTDLLEPGKAVVSASFSNHGQPTVVTYDFVKEDGLWKVNDIKGTTEKEAWSVRKILARGAREPKRLPGMEGAEAAPDKPVKDAPKPPSRKALER